GAELDFDAFGGGFRGGAGEHFRLGIDGKDRADIGPERDGERADAAAQIEQAIRAGQPAELDDTRDEPRRIGGPCMVMNGGRAEALGLEGDDRDHVVPASDVGLKYGAPGNITRPTTPASRRGGNPLVSSAVRHTPGVMFFCSKELNAFDACSWTALG